MGMNFAILGQLYYVSAISLSESPLQIRLKLQMLAETAFTGLMTLEKTRLPAMHEPASSSSLPRAFVAGLWATRRLVGLTN